MIKVKIQEWLEKLLVIKSMESQEERHKALDEFFTKDLAEIGLHSGDYVFHDITRDGVRRRDFIYGEDDDGSDIVIHVWTGGGGKDRITVSAHQLSDYDQE